MYLLFISYNSGLMHNNMYRSFDATYQSIEQLVTEENLNEKIISKVKLFESLKQEDDYKFCFSNGTWFHLQKKF